MANRSESNRADETQGALADLARAAGPVFDALPQPAWLQDPRTGEILAANEASLSAYGYRDDEFRGLTLSRLGGGPGPALHRCAAGTSIAVDIAIRPVDIAGRPVDLVVCVPRAEAAAQETVAPDGEKLAGVARSIAKVGGWSVDLRSGQIAWCDEVCEIHEMPHGTTLTVEDGISFYAPEFRERITHIFRACAEEGIPFDEELQIVTARGRRVWVRTIGEPIRGTDGAITHVHGAFQDITERTQTIQWRDQGFREVAQAAPQILWSATADGTVDYLNRALYDYAGETPQNVPPSVWTRLVHPDDLDRTVREWAAVIDSGDRYETDFRIRAADGTYRWHLVQANPIRDERGRIAKWQGAAVDIHDRRVAEDALRDSEMRFHAVARATADVIWDWDMVAGRIWWSEQFTLLFGHPLTRAATTPDFRADCIHPHDRDRVMDKLQAAFDGRDDVWADEYRFRRADGSYLDVEDRGVIIRAADGRAVRFVGGVADISSRKRAQQELRERVKELGCLYRVLELTTDDRRTIDEVCQAVADILPDGFVAPREAVGRIVIDGREHRSAGWVTPLQTVAAPILAGSKRLGFVEVGYAESVDAPWTGAGRFLDERALMNGVGLHVGRMIEERHMIERLAQSERIGAIGELTGGIAHDFNNLLTVILGNAELLVDRLADEPDTRAIAEMTQTAAERGAELTNRLLAFGRRQALDPRAVDVGRLIEDMRGLLGRTLGEHIEIDMPAGCERSVAHVDPAQLESAILNLCINARDAMPQGGCLTIEASELHLDFFDALAVDDMTPGDYVVIAVTDTGNGMEPQVAARAFEPFFTTKPAGKGSGLGLSMVFGFLKQSRGHVKLYSEIGHGTTVKLYLPHAAAGTVSLEDIERGAMHAGQGERILLVEDDELVRRHVEGLLSGLGYEVKAAEDGPTALALLDGMERVDLLFTDIVMPGGMNGRQLAEAAKARRPDMPVLFTSGYTENAILHHGRLDPGVHLLNKPYRRQDLTAKIRLVLDAAQSASREAV